MHTTMTNIIYESLLHFINKAENDIPVKPYFHQSASDNTQGNPKLPIIKVLNP